MALEVGGFREDSCLVWRVSKDVICTMALLFKRDVSGTFAMSMLCVYVEDVQHLLAQCCLSCVWGRLQSSIGEFG